MGVWRLEEKVIVGTPVVITGIFDKQIYRNERNGHTLFTIRTKEPCPYRNNYGSITCMGNIPVYVKGMPLKITGYWEQSKFGMQIHVQSIGEVSDSESITITYLTGICAGIGEATAKKIVNEVGCDIFSFVQKPDAEEILKKRIPNIDALTLIRSVKSSIEQREVFEFILKYGGSYPTAIKICEEYGMFALENLKRNPYKIGLKNGLLFEQCDCIAKDIKIDPLDKRRINALVQHVVDKISMYGHTYTTLEQIMKYIRYIVNKSSFKENIPAVIIANAITRHPGLVLEAGEPIRIYSRVLWNSEQDIAKNIERISNSAIELNFNEDLINIVENELGIKYGDDQKESFKLLRSTGIKILTGGPGTGKTTTIKGFIEVYKRINLCASIALCAPTGRAAQRLSETAGMEASTIHRLLDFKPHGKEFCHKNLLNPIEADMVIVDEISMVDTELMSILLGAIKNGSLVILSGDEDQLASVGPGNVLHDFIGSEKIETYRLTEIHRQKSESLIVQNARCINSGSSALVTGPDFEIIRVKDSEEALVKTKELVSQNNKTDDPFYLQVLTSTKKTKAGMIELNKVLQDTVNQEKKRINFGNVSFRLNDKVMMLANNYEKGYFNGDIGSIIEIQDAEMTVLIDGKIITIDRTLLDDITLCYATTIHKSQGSEFPIVIGVLPEDPAIMLKKNLLYTLITRAKLKIYLVVVGNALDIAVKNSGNDIRNTRLKHKLINLYTEQIPIIKTKEIM